MKILKTTSYLPRYRVTNEALAESNLDIDPGWTERVLGVKERRVVGSGTVADMAINAAAKLMKKNAGVHPSELDLILVATSSASIPPIASQVQASFNRPPICLAVDLNAVCAGFITAFIMACRSDCERVLLIGVDAFSRITDPYHRDSVFFGDGAGALLMTKEGDGELLGYHLAGGARNQDAFRMDGKYWRMDGAGVFDVATDVLPVAIAHTLDQAGLSPADIDHIVPHQASLNLLKAVAEKAALPFDKFRLTLHKYANTAAASIPITLADTDIKDGDRVLMFGIGAGWNWGAAVVRW